MANYIYVGFITVPVENKFKEIFKSEFLKKIDLSKTQKDVTVGIFSEDFVNKIKNLNSLDDDDDYQSKELLKFNQIMFNLCKQNSDVKKVFENNNVKLKPLEIWESYRVLEISKKKILFGFEYFKNFGYNVINIEFKKVKIY